MGGGRVSGRETERLEGRQREWKGDRERLFQLSNHLSWQILFFIETHPTIVIIIEITVEPLFSIYFLRSPSLKDSAQSNVRSWSVYFYYNNTICQFFNKKITPRKKVF